MVLLYVLYERKKGGILDRDSIRHGLLTLIDAAIRWRRSPSSATRGIRVSFAAAWRVLSIEDGGWRSRPTRSSFVPTEKFLRPYQRANLTWRFRATLVL